MYTCFYDITIIMSTASLVRLNNLNVCLYVQISDAVDNGHNKKAVQIADKILKKQGDLHCAKVGGDKFNHVCSVPGGGGERRRGV